MEPIKHLIIVKVKAGMKILDRPTSTTNGAITRRTVPNGTTLDAYSLHNIDGVPYARLVPQSPNKPEYIRIAERDNSIIYCDVIDLNPSADPEIITVLNRIAAALENK